jgi:hypothetical protein
MPPSCGRDQLDESFDLLGPLDRAPALPWVSEVDDGLSVVVENNRLWIVDRIEAQLDVAR